MANNDGISKYKSILLPEEELDLTDSINVLNITTEEVTSGPAKSKPSNSFKLSSGFGSKKMKSEIHINFPDIISTATCSELVIELIKYLLYLKEQIPYHYNQLKNVVERKKKWDLEKENMPDRPPIARSTANLAEQHFSKSCQAIDTLELIFQRLREEMSSVTAVALLLGATVASPQEAYIVELPPLLPAPVGTEPSRKCLTHLIRELVTSDSLRQMTTRSSRPTNIYVMLRKPASQDSWFELKPEYSIPTRCHQVSLKFSQPSSEPHFKIFVDIPNPECPSPMCAALDPHDPEECPREPSHWFHAQKLVKGFKDCYIGDQCATDIWLKL